MRKYFLYIVLFVTFDFCKNSEYKVISDNYIPKYTSVQLQERIRKYYDAKASDSLINLLHEWNKFIIPSTIEYVQQNDTIKNIYQVFSDLYKPFEFGNYKALNYFGGSNLFVIIQNEVKYAVVSSDEYKQIVYNTNSVYPNDTIYEYYRKTKKLLNFRPILGPSQVQYLYLTDEYRKAITDFLGLGSFKGDIFLNDTLVNRYKFLCPILPILYGHWGGYWHIESLPIIERIIFDEKFKHAAVDFRVNLEETVLQYRITKKSGRWNADNKWLKIRLE